MSCDEDPSSIVSSVVQDAVNRLKAPPNVIMR